MGISPSSVIQNGVTAYLSLSGSTVTVEVSSMSYSWRINGTNSGGDHGTYYISENRNASGSFTASDGHSYAFQVASGGNWSDGAIFTVTFDSGSGEGGGDSTVTTCQLIINQGEGTELKVYNYNGDNPFELSSGSSITSNDYIYVTSKALQGYELDYYSGDNANYNDSLGYQLYNLEYHHTGEESGNIYFVVSNYDDYASITSTATPIATTHIYNNNNSNWETYAPYIYDNNSGWNRYTPYVYNGTSWDRYS